ncbi:hypothetical protein F4810DRAFT_686588 [Camillea tinctor]|nr:hypothetical protein F4810DRAFT_686588 [Camillea tinctor]
MNVITDTRDIVGAATHATDAEGLEDHWALQQWLRSSGLASQRPSSINKSQPAASSMVIRMSDPQPGGTFLIIDKSHNRALICKGGYLHLEDAGSIDDGTSSIPRHWQWLCTERDGFKGFKNVEEGGFLGHNIWWNFYAKVYHHKEWEDFTLSKREDNYYWIQARHGWTHRELSAQADGSRVFAEQDGGTPWEFVEVR